MMRRVVLLVLSGLLLAGLPLAAGQAQQANRAALVVQFGDGRVEKYCVEFSEAEIKGYDVLARSGLALVADMSSPTGAAICKIGGEGCAADNCFCNMPNYWSYWHLKSDAQGQPAWLYSTLGASLYTVHPGDVEGWSYSAGAAPLVKPAFAEICPAASAPTATTAAAAGAVRPTATPPNTEPPPMTAIVIGALTSTPTHTRQPTATPVTPASVALVSAATATPTEARSPTPSPSPASPPAASPAPPQEAVQPGQPSAQPTEASPTPRPTRKPRSKASATPQAAGSAQKSSGVPLAMLSPTDAAMQDSAPTPQGQAPLSRFARLALLAGGITGYLAFMGLFVLLGIGIVVMLLRKPAA